MKFLKNLWDNFNIIIRPIYWTVTHSFDKEWDIQLNKLLDEHSLFYEDKYTVLLANQEFWITRLSNCRKAFSSEIPSRKTTRRVLKLVRKTFPKELL
jgi:hypothetical protein